MKNAPGADNTTHHLLTIKEPGDNLTELRKELGYHPDITEFAQHGTNFEDCLGRIALKLDIALDGMYDANNLMGMLVEKLRNKRMHISTHYTSGNTYTLLKVELIEKEGSVELHERDDTVATVVPETAIIVNKN